MTDTSAKHNEAPLVDDGSGITWADVLDEINRTRQLLTNRPRPTATTQEGIQQ